MPFQNLALKPHLLGEQQHKKCCEVVFFCLEESRVVYAQTIFSLWAKEQLTLCRKCAILLEMLAYSIASSLIKMRSLFSQRVFLCV